MDVRERGNLYNFKIRFESIENISGVEATINGFDLHFLFNQLSPAVIAHYISDQSSRIEVMNRLNGSHYIKQGSK